MLKYLQATSPQKKANGDGLPSSHRMTPMRSSQLLAGSVSHPGGYGAVRELTEQGVSDEEALLAGLMGSVVYRIYD